MNEEVKKLWVEALCSGKYKQGRGYLKSDPGNYCCLGVLCELYIKSEANNTNAHWTGTGRDRYIFFSDSNKRGTSGTLPLEVTVWAGIDTYDLCVTVTLTERNDSGHSFEDISLAISRHL